MVEEKGGFMVSAKSCGGCGLRCRDALEMLGIGYTLMYLKTQMVEILLSRLNKMVAY